MYRPPPPHFACLLPQRAKIPIIPIIFSQSYLESAGDSSSGNLFPFLLVPARMWMKNDSPVPPGSFRAGTKKLIVTIASGI